MNVYEQFRLAQQYRLISFLLLLLSPIGLMIDIGIYRYIAFAVIFGVAVIFDRQYKCPACNFNFDTRVSPKKLKYCSNCSIRLQD